MEVSKFLECIGSPEFFSGVPDSQLKALCNHLMDEYGVCDKHIIAANEGNCTAIAAGYHLATGKIPLVYMQNSGIGNIINPVASLLNDKVYAIPTIFVVGWRGEPGVKDEPQHIYQGEVTVKLLEDMDIATYIIGKDTTEEELSAKMVEFNGILECGKSVAFVIRKGGLSYSGNIEYKNDNKMLREDIIKHITAVSGEDVIISTTGKASRELFEIREAKGQSHKYDFLTVGSMGHSSSIALAVALNKKNSKIWCIDGDGAALMHLGSMAVVGNRNPDNLVHIVINNAAHETVGGMPTVAETANLVEIAGACGYKAVYSVDDFVSLDEALASAKKENLLTFIEVKAAIGSRENLGRPTTTALENKQNFMSYLEELN